MQQVLKGQEQEWFEYRFVIVKSELSQHIDHLHLVEATGLILQYPKLHPRIVE
jgi:hypothetical protein